MCGVVIQALQGGQDFIMTRARRAQLVSQVSNVVVNTQDLLPSRYFTVPTCDMCIHCVACPQPQGLAALGSVCLCELHACIKHVLAGVCKVGAAVHAKNSSWLSGMYGRVPTQTAAYMD